MIQHTIVFKDGLTVGQLVDVLSKLKKDYQILLSQDEEGNVKYKGIALEFGSFGKDEITFIPLTGKEIPHTMIFTEGLTIGRVVFLLSKVKKYYQIFLSKNEEGNMKYKGIAFDFGEDEIIFVPLDGTEIKT